EAPVAAFDLVTAAECFHRFDQPRVAALARRWLKPGGAFVTMGYSSFTAGDAPWRKALAEVVRAYVGEPVQRLQGSPNPSLQEAIADEVAVLRNAGFVVEIDNRDFEIEHEWTLGELLGNLRSTSVLSRAALANRHAAFEAELAGVLRAQDPSERYSERLSCGYTLARKA
ncbi:MAG TPA: class I SAM-dependent methyltransferase, partial [Caulobacteraceae bacterium]|nr:class I SAM-dependent methyltransferase [Caulobacteraceae bacterium]